MKQVPPAVGAVTESKIVGLDELSARLVAARQHGQRVVLANGVFDLLHVGHVRYLEAARREGELLVVGVNGDATATALKGSDRPILPAHDRAQLVAALAAVDYVIIFDTPTVVPLIEALRPDVHAKGSDYTTETVPERDAVRAAGGRVVIVGDAKAHASRDLLAEIRRRFTP